MKRIARKIATIFPLIILLAPPLLFASDLDAELLRESLESAKHTPSVWKIEDLLRRGADPNARNPDSSFNSTLLQEATSDHNADIAQVLIAAGADIERLDSRGQTALMRVDRNASVIQELIKTGAQLDATDRHGSTALSLASYHGEGAIVQLLLQAGADPNLQKTSDGFTPLIRAVRRERIHIVQILLENGARIDIKTKRGKTVFDFCKNVTILKLLREAE